MTKELGIPDDVLYCDLQYMQKWDFTEQPPTFSAQFQTVTAGANAGDDTSATLIGAIPRAARLLGGYLCVSANSAGIDANNTSGFVVAVGGTTYLSKTNSANLVANTAVSYGTPSKTDCAAGAAVTLAITNGTAADLNSAVCHTCLSFADSSCFPAQGLKVIATDGGTCSVSDGVKGVVALSPGSSDNDEIYMCTATEVFKFAANKTAEAEVLMQFSEANTDDANVFVGFTNAFAADHIVDNGAGPKSTGDYVGFWKIDGGTKWYCGAQSNGTATPTTDTLGSPETTAGGSSYQKLHIKLHCTSSTMAQATFSVDGVVIGSIHFAYASATEMQFGVGVKNGSANAETLNVDYMWCTQLR